MGGGNAERVSREASWAAQRRRINLERNSKTKAGMEISNGSRWPRHKNAVLKNFFGERRRGGSTQHPVEKNTATETSQWGKLKETCVRGKKRSKRPIKGPYFG